MRKAQVIQSVRPVERTLERPYELRYRLGNTACCLSFLTDEARSQKAAELVNSRVAVTLLPSFEV
ncbi:hypothetical protein AB4Y45_27975 [Paraburkholderia sp. EG287A]|uniref:hypothetical protein n=1 Tax=Paraburkholderia sp. EG287A TaxID=3237012 RepID=UPI0034D2AAEB